MVRNDRIEEPTVTGADEFGRDAAGRPPFEGEYPPPAYDDQPTTEFSRLVFDDDGDFPRPAPVPDPRGPVPTPVRPRIPGLDGPAVPPGATFRDPPPFGGPDASGPAGSSDRALPDRPGAGPAYQRPVMPPMAPPPGRGPAADRPAGDRASQGAEPPRGFGVPPQRDQNADSGPPPRRPHPGVRGGEVLREAQQFDVFRRDPVVPQQASPADGNDFDAAADRSQPAQPVTPSSSGGWSRVDVSVYDAGNPGFPPAAETPLNGEAVFDEYGGADGDDTGFDDTGFDDASVVQYPGDRFVEHSTEQTIAFDGLTFDSPAFEAPRLDRSPYDAPNPFGGGQHGGSHGDRPRFGEQPQFEQQPQYDPQAQYDQPQFEQPQFEQQPQAPAYEPQTFGAPHFDPPRFEAQQYDSGPYEDAPQQPGPQSFDAPADEPSPVFATPTISITPVAGDAGDREPQDQEPEMLVPWDSSGDSEDVVEAADYDDAAPTRVPPYEDAELAAVHRVIRERRDVRSTFLSDHIPDEVLTRVLEAAHTAPSVGFSQPWDFVVLRSRETRAAVHEIATRQRDAYAASLPKARARAFKELKIEAILDTPVNIVVTCDPTRGGRHTLGRYTQPQMAPYSSALAVENLWLAARAEGLGVGWVSFFDERELTQLLDLPEHLQVVAYLCVGYVREFPAEPELSGAGWAKRRPLAWAVHDEHYGRRALPGNQPVSLLDETLAAIFPLDDAVRDAAIARHDRMTKPPGSLGVLEDVSIQLAGLAGVCPPPIPEPAAVAIFAADHGVHAQGVTPWPQEVTAQMVANFLAGGAVVNAFAKQIGAEVCVVDVGVNANLPQQTGLIPRKIRYGTADLAVGPAMTRDEAVAAIEVGIETARDLVAAGNRCLLTGDMGIANTTASAALIAAFTGASPTQVTGYGTGIDEQTYAHKVEVVRRALDLHRPDPADPLGVLAAVGGLEHAALAGFILGAASLRTPVVLDGVIAGAAALVAQALAPDATGAMVAGHRSAESGHQLALEALAVVPLIDLELRLGEGSGAVLALPLVQAAVRALRDVATFESAGVAERPEDE